MAPEITTADWIIASASAAACIATVFLALFAWRQGSIMKKQTEIMGDQTTVQESQRNILHRQMQIQGEQRTIMETQAEISKQQLIIQKQQTTLKEKQTNISQNQTEIAEQQLTIIKNQETDRKNAIKRADLVISSRAEDEKVLDLIVENRGSGWANEITVWINGNRLEEYPPEICRLLPGSATQHEIGPGNKLDYLLEFPGVPPTNFRIDISWISENGIHSTNLGYIIPRQQLEAYRQEHKTLPVTAENGPRIGAYGEFLDVISRRPVNVHYQIYEIIPRLEVIQPFSSPEVKKTAKDIFDWAKAEMGKTGKPPSGLLKRIDEELKPIIMLEIEDIQSKT